MYKLNQDQALGNTGYADDPLDDHEPLKITEDLVMYYTDCKRLSEVQVIALRERNLAQGLDVLSSCPQLQIAYLQSNRFTDLVHLSKMTKLVKLNLSNNNISSLPSKEILSGLKSLRILFLDNNQMQKWKNLENLTGISSLYHLTLLNNPVVQTAGYRHFMVTKMPGLLALDDYIITDEERMEDVGHGVRFKALSQFMRLFAPEFKEGLTAEQHLFQVDLEIYKLRRLYEKNSPSIRIQALFKGYKRRVAHTNYFQKKLKSIIYIQKMVRGWLQRLRVKRELRQLMKDQGLEYLVMSQEELEIYYARQRLKKPMLQYIWRFRIRKLRNMMALKIQRMWRMYKERELSFIRALELEKYPVVYFLREQRIRFQEIINQTCKRLKGAFSASDIIKNFVSQGCEFQTLRYPDYTEFPYQMMPILHLTMPSSLSKVLPNRSSRTFPVTKRSIKHLMCKYGPDRGHADYQRLCKLQPRNCGVDVDLMREEVRARNKGMDRYEDFDTIFLPNMAFARALTYVVKEHNMMSQSKQILIFFKKPLLKVAAAVTLQTAFRHYRWRKRQQSSFQQEIITNRASLCMQAWWTSLRLTRRFRFLGSLKQYLARLDSNTIYLEETLYLELPRMITQIANKSTRFVEQYVAFGFEGNLKQIIIRNLKVARFETCLVPHWVLPEDISDEGFRKNTLNLGEQLFLNDLMAVFHFTDSYAAPEGAADTQVKDFNQIVNYRHKTIDLQKGLKFIEMRCGSVEEARKRALLVALLTFFFRQQLFVRVFTQRQLEEGFFLQSLKDMWIAYDIDFGDIEQRYHIKQFGEDSYDKQVRELNFAVSDAKDRIVADYLAAHAHLSNSEVVPVAIPSKHAMVPDRVIHLVQPRFFFRKPMSSFKVDMEIQKYSTAEDGFSSRQSLEQSLSPAKPADTQYSHVEMTVTTGTKKVVLNKHGDESLEFIQTAGKMAVSQQLSPLHTRVLSGGGNKQEFERSYLGPPKPQLSVDNYREFGFGEDGSGSLLQTKRKVKEYIEQINQQLTETKKQEISQIRDFRQYVKLIGNELQQQQLQEFISFKKEQKTLVNTFLTREKDRKLFENLNKRLTAIEFEHVKKRKKEESDFSKNLTSQMCMLNRVNLHTLRQKEAQRQKKDLAITVRQFGLKKDSAVRGNVMSQQISPRDNVRKLKITDLNDNFLSQAQESSARTRYASMGGQHAQFLDGAAGAYQANLKPTSVFHSARPSESKKVNSLIKQYERAGHSDSKGKLQSQKEFMIFDESVQLPAFPKKITRNAFERSYMKRIINVKMNEFSPIAAPPGGNMYTGQHDSFLLTNSYSQGFPYSQSRDRETISPRLSQPQTLGEDSLFKPQDITIIQESSQQQSVNIQTASIFGNSAQDKGTTNMSKNQNNQTLATAADDPTTYRTGGGGSTGRQQVSLPFNGGGSVHVNGIDAPNLSIGFTKNMAQKLNQSVSKEGKPSIWEYEESRRIVMPLKKLIS